VGATALEERAAAELSGHPDSILARRKIDINAIEDAALAGDPLAVGLVHQAAGHLGIAVAGLLNLMNPARVIIGGGLARLGELLLAPLRETVRSRTLVSSVAAAEILTSELGPRASAVGAATLVLSAALDDPAMFPRTLTQRRSR
jgi:predicted NBD/HSP70 family sugar kinase